MMNNTNPDRKVTVSKSAPWTVSIDGQPMPTHFASRTLAREAAADFRTNGVPEQHEPKSSLTGSALRTLRVAAKLSRGQLAAKVGLSVYALDKVEAGKLPVTPALAAALS